MSDDFNDFGFTAIDAVSSDTKDAMDEQIIELDRRLNLMYDTISPLLDNLGKDPEKETIVWPNRDRAVSEFKQKLADILHGVDNYDPKYHVG